MNVDKIKTLKLQEIKDIYCDYLKKENLSENTIQTYCTDTFYLYRKNGPKEFWALIENPNFENLAKEKLKSTLSKNSTGKININLNSYFYPLSKFRQFIYSSSNIDNISVITKTIPTPSIKEVEKYLELWDTLKNDCLQEKALDKLFLELAPKNTNITDILLKATTLNVFYSTNIFSIFPVAEHILSLDIDDRLNIGDETLVDDIKKITINNKQKQFYSFATKYCSHHNPEAFPIYDSFVDKVLCYFRDIDEFTKFKNKDLKNYVRFKSILCDFQNFYGLQRYSFKELDKFLWQFGKEYFPKNYNKKRNTIV